MSLTATENAAFLKKITDFLEQLGIPFKQTSIGFETFLPGVGIQDGVLHIDADKLIHPGDVLHEAGHYAVTPPENRPELGQHTFQHNPELGGEEMAAMLWSYAVCQRLEVKPEMVFHEMGYKGQSQWILQQYAEKSFFGLPLLQYYGMAHFDGEGPEFPEMKRWLRP